MLKNLGEKFARSKDAVLAATAKAAINQNYLREYGEILDLELDTQSKSLQARIELKGEPEILELFIKRYEIRENGEEVEVYLYGIQSSREWLNVLANHHVEGKAFEVPPSLGKMLKALI